LRRSRARWDPGGGKVYVDYQQNGHGRTIAGPFSVRPQPGGTVSTPLTWDEIGPGLSPRNFTIRNVAPRMEKLGQDPLLPVLSLKPDLGQALARLAERMGGG
jgi:bifunctional non-homologous end joining protein LigD